MEAVLYWQDHMKVLNDTLGIIPRLGAQRCSRERDPRSQVAPLHEKT